MKVRNHLNEITVDLDKMENFIRKNCSKFLHEMKNAHEPMYRGSKTITSVPMGKWAVFSSHLEGRTPRDTPKIIHDMSNKIFVEYFGWPARNGIFAGNYQRAVSYGEVYLFLPIGKYQYVWSPKVNDFYLAIERKNRILNWINMENLDSLWVANWLIDNEPSKVGKETKGYWLYKNKNYDSLDDVKTAAEKEWDDNITGNLFQRDNQWAYAVYSEFGKHFIANAFFIIKQTLKEYKEETTELIMGDLREIIGTYITGDLVKAIDLYGHEVCFNCRKYMLVDPIHKEFIMEIMNETK